MKNEGKASNGTVMPSVRIIRTREVLRITSVCGFTLRKLERQGMFPARRKVTGKAIGWLSSEVEEWLQGRTAWGSAETSQNASSTDR